MTKTQLIKQHCKQLKLSGLADHLQAAIAEAEANRVSYLQLVKTLLDKEIYHRQQKALKRRTTLARLPAGYRLDQYDYAASGAMDRQQLNGLRELRWLEQNFNVILMGPSGTGKTYIAAGLCFDAVSQGYRAYFKTMDELLKVLKMKHITRTAATEYKRILKAHLLVIDDIMMFPVDQPEAVELFALINELHEKASLIITTNKSPTQWAEVLKDTVLTTALLDRILYRCEIIKLTGNSYRMDNRKTIFENTNKTPNLIT